MFRRSYSTAPVQNAIPGLKTFSAETSSTSDVTNLATTVLFPDASAADLDAFLEQLPQAGKQAPSARKAIFFVTAAFANRFDELHQQAVQHIFDGVPYESFESIVAVVDGLPFGNHRYHAFEGISVCVSPLEWTEDRMSSDLKDSTVPVVEVHMTTVPPHAHSTDNGITRDIYAARVANTLFVNGRQYTLVKHFWQRHLDKTMSLSLKVDLSSVSIVGQNATPIDPLRFSLVTLTSPQRVISSMGNVLRLVAPLTREESVPASSELEQIVPVLLKHLQNEQQRTVDLRVFALVWSEHQSSDHPEKQPSNNEPTTLISKALRSKHWCRKFVSHLKSGARLFRVTSGGGGWGKKAGLLSLEPASDLNYNQDDSISGMFANLELEELTDSSAARTAPTVSDGDLVQFFASYHDLKRARKSILLSPPQDDETTTWNEARRFTFGTMIPPDSLESTASNWLTTEQVNIEAKEQMLNMGRYGDNEAGFANDSATSESPVPEDALVKGAGRTTELTEQPKDDSGNSKFFSWRGASGFLTTGPISISRIIISGNSAHQTAKHSTLFDIPETRFAFYMSADTEYDRRRHARRFRKTRTSGDNTAADRYENTEWRSVPLDPSDSLDLRSQPEESLPRKSKVRILKYYSRDTEQHERSRSL